MTLRDTELAVVGGGPGGYVAAIRAASLGLKVTVVDAGGLGGTCLNHGCIPSKAFISAANRIHDAVEASSMGVYADPYVDMAELAEWKDSIVAGLTSGIEALCDEHNVTVVPGRAEFTDLTEIAVTAADGRERIGFEGAIIATGSQPTAIPGFDTGAEPVLDSKEALALDRVPDRLVVVGAGYIGMELSVMFRKLGAEVVVVEMTEQVLPNYGSEMAEIVRSRADDLGVEFHFGQQAESWTKDGDGVSVSTVDQSGATDRHRGERVLVAVGRDPVTDGLGLDEIGVETTSDGVIPTDEFGRTSVPGVYAVGDVSGAPMLAHSASREGIVAAETLADVDRHPSDYVVPSVVYTDPEIATVGMTVREAEDAGHEPTVGEFTFAVNGRSLTLDNRRGYVRLVADAETQRLLGTQLVCPEASELVAAPTLAINEGLTVDALTRTVQAHPTLSEALTEAARDVSGVAIHGANG